MVALHWLGAALTLELLAHGWLMLHGGFSAARTFDLFQSHKSLGFVVLAVTIARLAARAVTVAPVALPGPSWERQLAAFAQAALYLLTLAVIVAGWLAVSASPLPIPTLFFGGFAIPAIAGPSAALFGAAVLIHWVCALAIAGLVALHVAGAAKHHFANRDETLARMLPGGGTGAA